VPEFAQKAGTAQHQQVQQAHQKQAPSDGRLKKRVCESVKKLFWTLGRHTK
jgi:hypothetical protein